MLDSLAAYLELRDGDITEIGDALRLFCGPGPVEPDAFDAVADGLYLVRLEREDDRAFTRLSVSRAGSFPG